MIKRLFFQISIGVLFDVALAGCNNASKFDREKWRYGDGLNYPLREDMVEDLMNTYHFKGMTYRQVIDSLGRPQNRDTLQLVYQVLDNSFDYLRKKPIRKKNLVIYFSKDSVVTKAEIYDHTNKK
jgi:outer membrane protein assembly factor BamE (lipoprotein component of BamABCDE complex)